METMLDTSFPIHMSARGGGGGTRVSVLVGTAARSVTLYIPKGRDSNTRGPRRSP